MTGSAPKKKPAPKKTDLDLISGVIEKLEKEQDKEYSRENRKALNSLNDAVNHLTRKQNKKG